MEKNNDTQEYKKKKEQEVKKAQLMSNDDCLEFLCTKDREYRMNASKKFFSGDEDIVNINYDTLFNYGYENFLKEKGYPLKIMHVRGARKDGEKLLTKNALVETFGPTMGIFFYNDYLKELVIKKEEKTEENKTPQVISTKKVYENSLETMLREFDHAYEFKRADLINDKLKKTSELIKEYDYLTAICKIYTENKDDENIKKVFDGNPEERLKQLKEKIQCIDVIYEIKGQNTIVTLPVNHEYTTKEEQEKSLRSVLVNETISAFSKVCGEFKSINNYSNYELARLLFNRDGNTPNDLSILLGVGSELNDRIKKEYSDIEHVQLIDTKTRYN
jgi:hypothetical protein